MARRRKYGKEAEEDAKIMHKNRLRDLKKLSAKCDRGDCNIDEMETLSRWVKEEKLYGN